MSQNYSYRMIQHYDVDIVRNLTKWLFRELYRDLEMATHSSILAWRIPGTGEPDGLPSMGSHRLGHD